MRYCDRRSSHVVIAGEDGGRRLCQRQDMFRGVQARPIGEIALRDEFVLYRQAGLAKRLDVAFEPARAGALVGVALDETNARMP